MQDRSVENGATNTNLSWPVSVCPWVWAMSGVFLTSVRVEITPVVYNTVYKRIDVNFYSLRVWWWSVPFPISRYPVRLRQANVQYY